jgi:hypothetical protein
VVSREWAFQRHEREASEEGHTDNAEFRGELEHGIVRPGIEWRAGEPWAGGLEPSCHEAKHRSLLKHGHGRLDWFEH